VSLFIRTLSIVAAVSAIATTLPLPSHAETPLGLAVVSRTIMYLPAWMAEKQGFFKAEGLDLKMEVYDGSDKIFADVRSGTKQIAIAATESTIINGYKGGNLRIIAGNTQRPPHFLISQPEIKTLPEIKGKTIGVVSKYDGTTFFVPDVVKKAGFTVADVKVEAVGGSPTRARLLVERKIDVAMQPYPLSYEAEASGMTNLGAVADIVPDYQFSAVIVDSNWAQQNRATLVAFLRALRRGTDYMFTHPNEAIEVATKELRTTPAFARRALEDTIRMDVLPRDLSVSDRSIQRVFDNVKDAGLLPAATAFDRSKFADDSYLAESRK
jgi:NitT/TauT family transport system substrate-binding protein